MLGLQKDPTVGRLTDPRQVVFTTYCRFFRRPTVGRFLRPQQSLYEGLEGALFSELLSFLKMGGGEVIGGSGN